MILGAHESIAQSPAKAFERAQADTAQTFQIFTKNARGWSAKPLDPAEAKAFRDAREATGLLPVAHASYLINLGAEGEHRAKSITGLSDELVRCQQLSIDALVLHPGSHPDPDAGLALIAEALDEAFDRAGPTTQTRVLLEVTAGQGSSLGHRFEHFAVLFERTRARRRLGICLDTCHLHAAGHDLTTPERYEAVMAGLGETLKPWGGLALIGCFHLNDCKKPLGCRVDRHADIGEGTIGLGTFECLVKDKRFTHLPGILETPSPERYREALGQLRELARSP